MPHGRKDTGAKTCLPTTTSIETGSHYISLVSLKLIMYIQQAGLELTCLYHKNCYWRGAQPYLVEAFSFNSEVICIIFKQIDLLTLFRKWPMGIYPISRSNPENTEPWWSEWILCGLNCNLWRHKNDLWLNMESHPCQPCLKAHSCKPATGRMFETCLSHWSAAVKRQHDQGNLTLAKENI